MRILKWFQQRDAEMSVPVGKARNNTVRLTGAACTGSFLLGCGKLIVGVLSASFFTCANAFYTFGMVAAKLCALKGIAVPASKQYSYYRITVGRSTKNSQNFLHSVGSCRQSLLRILRVSSAAASRAATL